MTEKVLVVRLIGVFFILLGWEYCRILFLLVPRKPKHHAGQRKNFVSLSFTAPSELEEPMNRAAASRGMNRSQYISWLVQQDIYVLQRMPSASGETLLPKIPPRIRRLKKKDA